MPETKIWDHFSIQIYPLLVGNMASETTFGHWKVVFSWGKGRKMTFSQNPLSSRFWASGFWMSILSSANFKKDPPWYIFSLSVHAPATSDQFLNVVREIQFKFIRVASKTKTRSWKVSFWLRCSQDDHVLLVNLRQACFAIDNASHVFNTDKFSYLLNILLVWNHKKYFNWQVQQRLPHLISEVDILNLLQQMIESSVWPFWWADCHCGKLQLGDGVGGDGCWYRRLLPLLVRAGDHIDGNGKAGNHDWCPRNSRSLRLCCGDMHQTMDCWTLQKVTTNCQCHDLEVNASDFLQRSSFQK